MLLNGSRCAANLPLLRVPGGPKALPVVVQSVQPLTFATHWAGRTLLCPVDDCPLCLEQQPSARTCLVVSPHGTHDVRGYLLEVGSVTWFGLVTELESMELDPPSGALVEFLRGRKRGHLRAAALGREPSSVRPGLASARRLVQAVSCLYRLPQPLEVESVEDWAHRVQPAVRAAAAAAVHRE